MHNYNYVNTLWFGTVSFDSCNVKVSRFMLCLYCCVYYVYDNPTYEVANKLICILYLVSVQSQRRAAEVLPAQVWNKLAKSTRLPGSLPVFYHFYPSTRFFLFLPVLGIPISKKNQKKKKKLFVFTCKYRRNLRTN